mmetsp:Transcript_12714/g.29666  ORF Transcript_12714/g.29666 Transcript_12714/m.29666 type:complete len:89 (-) Transcript_12714:154-420(-)
MGYFPSASKLLGGRGLLSAGKAPEGKTTELVQTTGVVLPQAATKQQTTMLVPYGMLKSPTRHFFSDGDGLWGEHNPHFGNQKQGDARW